MPELPEVETIRRGLERHIAGQTIISIQGQGGRLVRNNPGGMEQLRRALTGARVVGLERRGKFMWMILDGPAEEAAVIHLGMSGQVRTASRPPQALDRHEHIRLTMSSGIAARFIDPRMFGHVTLSDLADGPLGRKVPERALHIAPDLLELGAPGDLVDLARKLNRRARPIKTMLLDQNLVSGVGNIYADEGLFRSGVHGSARGVDLSVETLRKILLNAQDVMTQAVAAGGTSFDTLYVDAEGNPGYFERELRVYGRENQECLVCGAPIEREVIAGRSHFHCKFCQPASN